jgi:3-oxoacyl-[acyl-carrier-protein] synthase-3
LIRANIIGIGAALPAKVLHNNDLDPKLETSHEWIVARTGIEQRYIAADGELTSHLAIRAGKEALASAKLSADDINYVILATTTPDDTMPSTATKVQHGLGMKRGAAFDINAACSGFVYAMTVADSLIRSGAAKNILVIGAETYSRIMDWTDRSTCVLFGDGAAAVVLKAQDNDSGILYAGLHSDGQFFDQLYVTGGVSATQTAGFLTMQGKEIYRHAVGKMPDAVNEALAATNLSITDIRWLVPHQANQRILAAVAQKLGIDDAHIISTVHKHANTSAASIPLALYEGVNDGRIKKGDIIACPALGAGLTWGAILLKW